MKAQEFVDKLVDIAKNYKTLYVMGCFGAPLNANNKKRYTTNHKYNKQEPRRSMIMNASSDTFGFDCVCLIKGVLWGWNGNVNAIYGGAKYASNGVADMTTEAMINFCANVSTNFDKVEVGELMWMKGHVGIYIGDRLVVECSPAWENKVQITGISGNTQTARIRQWKKHGKLPWIDYGQQPKQEVTVVSDEERIWNFLLESIGNEYGVAGLMGNLYAESALRSNNLQNTYEKKFNLTDETYTAGVDNGTYTNFVNDCAGYGLAQWTFWSRKQNLYQYAKQCGASIGDLQMQLEFLVRELKGYTTVWNTLISATSVKEASDVVLTQYERPADQSENMKNTRAKYGQGYYDKYATGKPSTTSLYKVITTASVLNVRTGPGTNFNVVTGLPKGTVRDVYEQSSNWGKIDEGWICLDYTQRIQ